jgi:hypothetical protein
MRLSDLAAPPDVMAYRNSVSDLVLEIAGYDGHDAGRKAEAILAMRLEEPRFAAVLAATPGGTIPTIERLLLDVHGYATGDRGPVTAAGGLIDMIEVYLRSQIDAVWWGRKPPFQTDAELLQSTELVDLEPLRKRGLLGFQYRLQAGGAVRRVTRAVQRRAWPDRTPHTPGLLHARARREGVALLNQFAAEFAVVSPPGTPPLWITSLTRSIEQQYRLRALGYSAMLPSSHCSGYGMDIELAWFRRFHAHDVLEALLLERQAVGDINIIDEGQVWHVCIAPGAVAGLAEEYESELGS